MSSKIWKRVGGWFPRHYVGLVFGSVLLVCVVALSLGVWRVPFVVADLLGQLEHSTSDPAATRGIVIALAAVLATITIFGTLIAQAIRVWTNERQTHTIEQGHVTDRLTKAIEQLGAEKQVKRIERTVDGIEVRDENSVPVVIEITVPNLEVRLGAIYALERIAQDSARDHITIMEILCAYIRENAKAADAEPSPFDGLPDSEEGASLSDRLLELMGRSKKRGTWLASIAPRVDVQAAITVIGRRRDDRIRTEQAESFRLDLRGTCLRCANLTGARLEGANLTEALLEGANLREARLGEATLWRARLEEAILLKAQLDGANLTEALLEGANLREARLAGANLWRARLENSALGSARLEMTNLREARLVRANLGAEMLEGVSLIGADLRSAKWADASIAASPAHFADLRDARDLTQAQLNGLIGNKGTLLPEGNAPDTSKLFHVWSCWEQPPPNFDEIVAVAAGPGADDAERARLRAKFLCGPDNPREKTGTPLALDAPYPEGHPLAE